MQTANYSVGMALWCALVTTKGDLKNLNNHSLVIVMVLIHFASLSDE